MSEPTQAENPTSKPENPIPTTPIPNAIMPLFEDEPPKKKKSPHELGEDLATLSLDELEERIRLLKAEIERIETAIQAKRASANVAASFFKR